MIIKNIFIIYLYDEPISTFFIDDINYLYTKGITRHQNNRSPDIRRQTLMRDSYKCMIDSSHKTFISKSNAKQYVESHHIIPMARQDTYTDNLDCLENTISLCPCCHRKIHYAID